MFAAHVFRHSVDSREGRPYDARLDGAVSTALPHQLGMGSMGQTLLAERARTRSTSADRVVTVATAPTPSAYAIAKRTLDIVFSAVGLAVTWPALAVIAVWVRLDSAGPILFRQPRVGRTGRVFTFYKFRTMYADARQRFPELYAYRFTREEFEQMMLKTADDPRLTPLGHRLRRTSLDELPNLWNVLRGDLSRVGPRPELPEMASYYKPEELAKF